MASHKTTILILKYLIVSLSFGDVKCGNLTGLFAAVFTPVDPNGHLAVRVVPQYAQYLADKNVKGVLISGTAGEGPTLTVAEVKKLTSAWMAAAGPLNIRVIVQIGGRPLPDIEDLAAHSEREGVDAIMTLPELYFKPYTVEELVYNMECIARAAPRTPLFYYDIPEITNVHVDMVQLTIKATERIPTFKGLKEQYFDTALRVQPILKKDQIIYIAKALFLAPAVFMGFDNFIITEVNLFPRLFNEIISEGKKCKLNEARRIYEELMDLSDTIARVQSPKEPIPAYKAAMPLVTGINMGPARAPELALTDEQEVELEDKLRNKRVKLVDSEEVPILFA